MSLESKRAKLQKELHKLIDKKGTTHKDTVKKSQELDKVITQLQKRRQ